MTKYLPAQSMFCASRRTQQLFLLQLLKVGRSCPEARAIARPPKSFLLPIVFLQVSTMLSRGAWESRDNVSGLSIGLNKGTTGLGKYKPSPPIVYHSWPNSRGPFGVGYRPKGSPRCAILEPRTREQSIRSFLAEGLRWKVVYLKSSWLLMSNELCFYIGILERYGPETVLVLVFLLRHACENS